MTHPAIPIVRRLAAEHPDRHTICRYTNEDSTEPVCIIGHAVHELGVPLGSLAENQSMPTCDALSLVKSSVLPSIQELDWLSTVQFEQDNGASWSEAVQTADKLYPL